MSGAEHFRFSPEILKRLGEELIPHVDQGIVELVRNSYDADATRCQVELQNTEKPGGAIRIVDNGRGMAVEDIRDGWLILGRSGKQQRTLTPRGRLPVGEKGLGRLAALRMGASAVLETRPEAEPALAHRIEIDWRRFDDATTVESVPLSITSLRNSGKRGTTIELNGLRVVLGRREVDRLARALLLLADPFSHSSGFRPQLLAPSFADLERKVREGYFDVADYRLTAQLSATGKASATVRDVTGRSLWHTDRLGQRVYESVAASFELWVFLLDQTRFGRRRSVTSLTEIRQWLAVLGGVHLYHRNLRVHPYGDPGHDWLEMNLARAQSPEERPSTNTSVGRIIVDDPSDRLIQKTDRTGFIENDAFQELRRFAQDALDWMARERVRERERRKAKEKKTAVKSVQTARQSLDEVIKAVPAHARGEVERAVRRLEGARERERRTLQEDLQLYRTLGTVGTTTAVFAHEAAKPATQIERTVDVIEARGKRLLGSDYASQLEPPVSLIRRSAATLRTFAAFPLRLLRHEKRRSGLLDLNVVVRDTAGLFASFLADSKIELEFQLVEAAPQVRGTVASIEAIISNLIINSINAFNSPGWTGRDRRILVRSEISGGSALVHVLDSGPGITGISVDDVWLPGRTTIAGGTGLGLTIVRDAATDMGGSVHALGRSDLGGAEFVVELPLERTES